MTPRDGRRTAVTRDDEETRFWSINDELEPDASGQISTGTGAGALEPDPGVERPAAAGGLWPVPRTAPRPTPT